MPAVRFPHIPRTAFDADRACGADVGASVRVSTDTRLERNENGEVELRFRGINLATYRRNGAITIYWPRGRFKRRMADRIAVVVPYPWRATLVRATDWNPERLRLTFGDNGYRRSLTSAFTFDADGS